MIFYSQVYKASLLYLHRYLLFYETKRYLLLLQLNALKIRVLRILGNSCAISVSSSIGSARCSAFFRSYSYAASSAQFIPRL